MPSQYFTPKTFKFFKLLKKNNKREWFAKNKDRFEVDVKTPFLRFIEDFAGPLGKISPHFVADSQPTGGSLFRIYRDMRFSPDKSPYKTAGGAHFRHKRAKNVHAPGFYLHVAPGEVLAGTGIWRPDGKALAKIRDFIVTNPNTWKKITSARAFRASCTLSGDTLRRPPRGYDPEHQHIEDLKRKDFITMTPFSEKDAGAPDFLKKFTKACKTASSMVEFICEALGLQF